VESVQGKALAERAFFMSILVVSQFTVANAMAQQVTDAFMNRPHLVDSAPGFLKMEVHHSQDNANEFWLLTWWTDDISYQTWHRSHAYHESHSGIPKGLKLLPKSTKITVMTHIAD